MTNITQRIPNLLRGISQQPDEKMFLGQVRDMVNGYPDYTIGLLKKPGEVFVNTLADATPSGKWFPILRDQNEKYVAQYDGFQFRVWDLTNGGVRKVEMNSQTATIPGACNYTLVKQDGDFLNTAYANMLTARNTLQANEASLAEVQDNLATKELVYFDLNYSYEAEVLEIVVSGILQSKDTGLYFIRFAGDTLGGNYVDAEYWTPEDYATVTEFALGGPLEGYRLGTERTDEHPIISSSGYRLFELVADVAPSFTQTDLANAEASYASALSTYNSAVSTYTTALSDYLVEIGRCDIVSVPGTSYLNGATPDDIEVLTLTDYTFVLNKKKVVQMTSNTITDNFPNRGFVQIKFVGSNTRYEVVIREGPDEYAYSYTTTAPYIDPQGGVPTPADAIEVASQLTTLINQNTTTGGSGNNGHGVTATRVANGIFLNGTLPFELETRGSVDRDGIFGFQETTSTPDTLPLECRDGYQLRVVNAQDVGEDDYWVKFITETGATYGVGYWEETLAPGLTYEFDPLTMPHQLVRQSDGTFTFEPSTWIQRFVGDNTTNPLPTFVGKTISGMFFYRNRLGFLTGDTVVMSRASGYFNFFGKSAIAVTDDDPIDISVATLRPVVINYVQPMAVGLVLFGETQQFILTTDSDILSPRSAKINTLSGYETDTIVKAQSMGLTTGFISKDTAHTRLMELQGISTVGAPQLYEPTKGVPEFLPRTIDSFVASPTMSKVSLGTIGQKNLYLYSWLQQGDRRVIDSWFRWELTNNLLLQFFDFGKLYLVGYNGSEITLSYIDLSGYNEEGRLRLPSGQRFDPVVDLMTFNPHRTYNAANDETTIYLDHTHVPDRQLAVLQLADRIGTSEAVTSVGRIFYPTVTNDTAVIPGDFRGREIVIGYVFNMWIDLPKFYQVKEDGGKAIADITGELILHRMFVSLGISGPVSYIIKIQGKDNWQPEFNTTLPGDYDLDTVNVDDEGFHVVPLYQRNRNLRVTLYSDSPLPATFNTITWEGKFVTRSYSRT